MYIHTAAVADADTAVERFVAGDLAAAHGERAVRSCVDTAAVVGDRIAVDAAAVHVEGTAVHIHGVARAVSTGDLAAACAVEEGEITATEVYVEDVKIAIGRDRKAVQAERQLACQLGFCGHGHVLRQAVCP